MQTRIALLRGINVGKAKRIAMTDLRTLLENLGFHHVRTLLNSGNIVFESESDSAQTDAGRITSAVTERTGTPTNVLVLDAEALDQAIETNPLAQTTSDPTRLLLGFFLDPHQHASLEALKQQFPSETFVIGKHACYLWCTDGILASPIASVLASTKFRDRITTRNWATILKLQAMTRT